LYTGVLCYEYTETDENKIGEHFLG